MSDWKTLSSETVYETPWIKVHRDKVLNHNGKELTYSYLALQHPSILVVAVDTAGRILLQRNYRYTIDKHAWEIPAGHSDGQDLLQAARRELLEETGLASDEWVKLGTLYQACGIGNIPFTAFLARNVKHVSDERDEDEEITEQTFLEVTEIDKMLITGEAIESAHVAAIYLAKIHGLIKKEK